MPSRRLRAAFALAASSALAVACAHHAVADADMEDESDAAASNAQGSHIGYVVTSSVASQDPKVAAASLVSSQLWPAGCVTRTRVSDTVVDVSFHDCTGPFGLVHIDGDVIVTFTSNPDQSLHADHESSNLTANGSPVTLSATADITVSGTTRNVKWHGSSQHTNSRGEPVSHTSDLTIVVDAASRCRDSNGSAVTTIGAREIDSQIEDYRICLAPSGVEGCPSGTIVHTHVDSGRVVIVTFDGTDRATIAGPRGTLSVPLVCGG